MMYSLIYYNMTTINYELELHDYFHSIRSFIHNIFTDYYIV